MRWGFGVVFAVVLSMMVTPAFAGTDPIENFIFQGVLKDNSGGLITGQKDIALRIYSTQRSPTLSDTACDASGLCLWRENQTNIGVTNGVFTVNAGNTTSFTSKNLNFTTALYLEVIVKDGNGGKNDQVMSPRLNMTSSPFALAAARASGSLDVNADSLETGNVIDGVAKHARRLRL